MPPKAARPVEGVEFPKDAEGNRSTMGVNKAAFASALRAVNSAGADEISGLPDKKWRRAYQKNVVEQVRESAKSPAAAVSVAKAGLDYLHQTMVFVRPPDADGKPMSLQEAMSAFTDKKFKTHEIQGQAPRVGQYSVSYKKYATPGPLKELKGNDLANQIETWVRNGTIEMSCGNALTKVAENPEWIDLRDTYFVLFGASSAMGPFFKLMDLGANVIALDLDRPQIWEKLIKETRGRAGKLIFPVKEAVSANASDEDIAKVAGCNLLTDTPEIRTWLQDLYPKERLICMALAYLDGALFVKVSMAMDAIIASLIEKRGVDKMAAAYLCTPTDAHLCTSASVEAVKANFRKTPAWVNALAPILGQFGKAMKRNIEKPLLDANGVELEGLHVIDCIIPEQGPNYILAKRLQHWRAVVSRDKGCLVSSNVAPSTATASVLSNVLFALGYMGMTYFRPMEITYQETSNSVMAALLIRDVRDPTSASNPKTPLRNPLSLMTDNAFHGGCWRTAHKFQSLGAPALIGYVAVAFLVTPYLLFYNMYQAVGWGRALAGVISVGRTTALWGEVGSLVTFFQFLGVMEIVHAALGVTRANVFLTAIQMISRWVVVAFLNECPSVPKSDTTWIPTMIFAWCVAEVVRYSYYSIGLIQDIATNVKGLAIAMKLIKVKSVEKAADPAFKIPYAIMWLRYSAFIVLYPMGVMTGEIPTIFLCLDCIMQSMSAQQPGTVSAYVMQTLKMFFDGKSATTIQGIVLFAYIVGLPTLFGALWATRKKVLGGPAATKKKKSQ